MAKKPSRKTMRKKLYKLAMQIVHLRGKCELCGKSGCKLDAHHIEGRAGALYWWLNGIVLLCFNCHRRGVHNEASSIQAQYRDKLLKLKGEKVMTEELPQIKDRYFSMAELEEMLEEYTTKYNALREQNYPLT